MKLPKTAIALRTNPEVKALVALAFNDPRGYFDTCFAWPVGEGEWMIFDEESNRGAVNTFRGRVYYGEWRGAKLVVDGAHRHTGYVFNKKGELV